MVMASRCATSIAADERPEGQQEAHGDCRHGLHSRAPWVRTPQQAPGKACSASRARPPEDVRQRHRARKINACGPVCSRAVIAVIQEVAEEMGRRDPSASKTRVALTDGERALQIRVDRKLKVTLILDLIHALKNCGKPLMSSMPRPVWMPIFGVMHRTLRILEGNVGQEGQGAPAKYHQTRPLVSRNENALEGVADYLYRNRTRMRYDEYLRQRLADRQWSCRGRVQEPDQRPEWSVPACAGPSRWPRP